MQFLSAIRRSFDIAVIKVLVYLARIGVTDLDKLTILRAAVTLAETYGYQGVYKRHIAAHLKCAMGTINHHWGTMDDLRAAMVKRARATRRHRIIMDASERRAAGE